MSLLLSQDKLALIVSQLLALPSDVNPYAFLSTSMHDQIPHLRTKVFSALMWLSVASNAVALLCHLGTVGLRVKRGHFWVARMHTCKNGRVLVPNVAVIFSVFGILYSVISIMSNSRMALYMLPAVKENTMVWTIIALLFLTLQGWTEVWSCAAAIMTKDDILSPAQRRARVPSWLFNFIVIALPVAYISAATVISVKTNLSYNKGIRSIQAVFDQLDSLASTWAGEKLGLASFQQLAGALVTINGDFRSITDWAHIITTYELSVNCLLLATWLPLVVLAVRDLQHQISFMQQDTQCTGQGPISSDDSEYASQQKTLISLCRQRIINATLGFVIGLAYVAILIIPVDRGMIAMLEHPHLGQTFTIASALIYAALGTPISIVLLRVSWKTYHISARPSRSSKSSGLRSQPKLSSRSKINTQTAQIELNPWAAGKLHDGEDKAEDA